MRTNKFLFGLAGVFVGSLAFAALTVTPLFQEPAQATKQHKMCQKVVGEWAGTITMHDPSMGPEPVKAPCSESFVAVGDLWTTSSFSMDMMGMPFNGASAMGYDADKGKFVGTWIDSTSTTLTIMEGDWDEAKKAIVMHYEMKSPEGEMYPVRSEFSHTEDSYTSKFFNVAGGTDTIMMEIDMKRSAKAAINAGAGK